MNNKELIDKILNALIMECNEKCNICKHIVDCTSMCGIASPDSDEPIDYKYLEETRDLQFIAKNLNIL